MVRFLERRYPSANSVLLEGPAPVLVDTGFGSDAEELLGWLGDVRPALVINTHFHSDHVGGNHAVQARFGAPIAASTVEAGLVNRRDPEACEAAWLRQPIEAYSVSRTLEDGDFVETGASSWLVVGSPGHTEGHLSLFCAEAGVLVLGDALHQADVGWLSPLRPGALAETAATLQRLAALPARFGYSGHGAAIVDLPAALGRARRRVDGWRRDPAQVGWHACKRIFAHALMLEDGVGREEIGPMLLGLPWFEDHARLVFGAEPQAFVGRLVDEMLRADAAYWEGDRLVARAGYRAPLPGWLRSAGEPERWAVSPPLPA